MVNMFSPGFCRLRQVSWVLFLFYKWQLWRVTHTSIFGKSEDWRKVVAVHMRKQRLTFAGTNSPANEAHHEQVSLLASNSGSHSENVWLEWGHTPCETTEKILLLWPLCVYVMHTISN